MTYAILKLSNDKIGGTSLTGGICGSAFFIKENLALTANHVINTQTIGPNTGYKLYQYWLLGKDGSVIEFAKSDIKDYPDYDTTTITISKNTGQTLELTSESPNIDDDIYNEGFVSDGMPILETTWTSNRLEITKCNLSGLNANGNGKIKDIKKITLNANDVKLNNIEIIEASYPGRKGMSGGPMLNSKSEQVIGIMSIGFPEDATIKTSVSAVSILEIMRKLK